MKEVGLSLSPTTIFFIFSRPLLMDTLSLFSSVTRFSASCKTEFYPTISTTEAGDSNALLVTISAHSVSKFPEKITIEYSSGPFGYYVNPAYSEYSDQPFYKKGFQRFRLYAPTGDITVKFWTRMEPIIFAEPVIIR